ncbi:MAG: Gfo/Idh/MocA family oxidoreductase [Pseudomonadota bacterium]
MENAHAYKNRHLRLGMVGGGKGALIGAVHRIAARLDDHFAIIAGALASDPARAQDSGTMIGLAPERIYDNYRTMAESEAARDDGIDAVAIVTPNHLHSEIAQAFLEKNIHVICDKPLTATLEQAKTLFKAAKKSKALFILTHNYTGYPLVRHARQMVANGELGSVRVIQAEYPQGWLHREADADNKQASWRGDPTRSGIGGCVSDIGTHALNLAQFITGLEIESLAADLHTFVPGRALDDNVHVLLRFKSGARGMLWASQVAPGAENNLGVRIYGEDGGLAWYQEEPNKLLWTRQDAAARVLTRAGAETGTDAARVTRIPPGHPEGYLEGFANIYVEAAAAIRAAKDGKPPPPNVVYPSLEDGMVGMAFIDACVRSSQNNAAWVTLDLPS